MCVIIILLSLYYSINYCLCYTLLYMYSFNKLLSLMNED